MLIDLFGLVMVETSWGRIGARSGEAAFGSRSGDG
jgi:hypothetical protein